MVKEMLQVHYQICFDLQTQLVKDRASSEDDSNDTYKILLLAFLIGLKIAGSKPMI